MPTNFYQIFYSIFLEPPGAPGEPSITDFDNKSVTLKWAKPKDDGGRPISHYIIQKKDKFGGWFDALVTDDTNCTATIDDLEARVPGLSEGKWYQFRVIAVNKAGESDPSPQTRPHLCRHKNCKIYFSAYFQNPWKVGAAGSPRPAPRRAPGGPPSRAPNCVVLCKHSRRAC